jgi:transposase
VVNAILYKLKTGCQWALLPVKVLFGGKILSQGAVYYRYNKWRKSDEWKSVWVKLLDKYRNELDMSSVDLDGSHTAALRGGEEVGYQGRKKRNTSNALHLTDRQGLPLAMFSPKSGEHYDVHDIEKSIGDIFNNLEKSHIRVDGLFLNADAGFDCDVLRDILREKEIIANICINKRRENAYDIFVDDELYAERYSIERTNAWMDCFRTLLNRFDTTVSSWISWNYLAFAVLLLKKISRKQKV